MSRSLKQRLQHVNDGLDTAPLLTDAEVREALHRAPTIPAPEPSSSWWSRNRTSVSIGTAALAVATVVAFVILPDESFLSPSHPGELRTAKSSDAQEADPTVIGNAVSAPELAESEVQNGQGAATQEFANVDEIQRAAPIASSPNGLSTTFLQLSDEELSTLGLTVTTKSIRYDEDGFTIIVGTSGIASKGTLPSATQGVTPRHVSLYRNGQVWASWYDGEDPTTTPNDLIPVHVHLETPSSATFPNADVILWYEPTDDFLTHLSPTHRREVGVDLQSKNGDATYVERSTHSSRITSSSVFPNPVHDNAATMRLQLAEDATTTAEVIDINGRTVLRLWKDLRLPAGQHDRALGPLTDLANGMYLILVIDRATDERLVQRLLIER